MGSTVYNTITAGQAILVSSYNIVFDIIYFSYQCVVYGYFSFLFR